VGPGVFALAAQTPSADPTIRVSVNLVQVDAMVTDAQGHRVAGLKPEDFEILEDGKPQKITRFSYVQGAVPPVGAASRPTTFARQLRPEDIRRTIVLVADDLSFGPAEFQRVRAVLKDFVDRRMQPGDLVSIMTTSGGMGAREQLTNDKQALYAAIARIVFSPGRNQFGPFILGEEDGKPRYKWETDDRALAAMRAPYFAAGSTSAVGYAIQALRDMPGRKAVALFSAGFTGATPPIVEMAQRSSVVVYTFDMRGIIATWDGHLPAGFWASQGSMEQLASHTGGVCYHESNNFGASLASALDDMSSYYLLGYQPQREDFDEVNGRPRFHRIQVRMLRPGLRVRSRDGFIGVPDEPSVSNADAGGELRKALNSPFAGGAVPVELSADYSATASGRSGHLQATLRTLMVVDAGNLTVEDIAGGKKRLVLDVLAGIWGDGDKPIASVDRKFTIEKTAEDMASSLSGLAIGIDVPVAKPGGYQMRAAVRDAVSGQSGSATRFIEIPDFNGRSLVLSSLRLSDRVVAPGMPFLYDCEVFGARRDKETAKPKLEMEVRLFRGPEKIFTGHRIPVESTRAAGQIKLPPTLPPGEYSIELAVYDTTGKGPAPRASQWADFRLAEQD
jgi:VWFA-related protein